MSIVIRGARAACLLLVLATGAAAAPPGARDGYETGNRLYQDGRFSEAAEAYEGVLRLGVSAPELEYNLGSAYLKAGRVGPAVLHLRRAVQAKPTFGNARVNLEYARSLTRDVKTETSAPSPWERFSRLRLGPERAAAACSLIFAVFVGLGILRLRRLRQVAWAAWAQGAAGALLLLLVAALVFEWSVLEGSREGVVLTPEIEVRTGPDVSYTVSFRLHEGTEVDVLRESGGWVEVRVSSELQGWVPPDALVRI